MTNDNIVKQISFVNRFITSATFASDFMAAFGAATLTFTQQADGSIKAIETGEDGTGTFVSHDYIKAVKPTVQSESKLRFIMQMEIIQTTSAAMYFGIMHKDYATTYIGMSISSSNRYFLCKENNSTLKSVSGLSGWDLSQKNTYEIVAYLHTNETVESFEAKLLINGRQVASLDPVKTTGTHKLFDGARMYVTVQNTNYVKMHKGRFLRR